MSALRTKLKFILELWMSVFLVLRSCGDIFDVNGGDAAAVAGDIVQRITSAAHDPREVCFPSDIESGFEQNFHRNAAVGQSEKLKIMVVSAKGNPVFSIAQARRI